jgi:phosphatidylglycerophosphate synthase
VNLPNLITLARIVLAIILVPLLFIDQFGSRLAAFVIFLMAALSDLWDGYLARAHGQITDGWAALPLALDGRRHLLGRDHPSLDEEMFESHMGTP